MLQANLKMTKERAEELIRPLYKQTARGISEQWATRLIEALEYVIENETKKESSEEFDGTFMAKEDEMWKGLRKGY